MKAPDETGGGAEAPPPGRELAPWKKAVVANVLLLVLAAAAGAEHGLRLWRHFHRGAELVPGRLAFEAAGAALMGGVVAICAGRLIRLGRARRDASPPPHPRA